MRKFLIWFLAGIALVVVVIALVAMKQLPTYIAGLVNEYFEKKMPNAHFEMGEITVSALSPGRMTARAIKYVSSKKGIAEVEAEIGALTVNLDLMPLMKGEVRIGSISIQKPRVIFRDSDAKPSKPARENKKRELHFEVRAAEISGGEFQYVRMTHGTVATLNVHDISATVAPLGLGHGNLVDVKARGRIEDSGTVALRVRTPLFESPVKVDVEIDVNEQNLADLTPFFKENAGVELHGVMIQGRGLAKVEGDQVDASVFARYKGFDLKLHKMYDRSEAAAFFTNLGIAIAAHEKNLDKDKQDQKRGVRLKRETGEPMVGFILRALKEAALRVSMARES